MRTSVQHHAQSEQQTGCEIEPDGRHPDDFTILKSYSEFRQTKLIQADGSADGAVNDTHFRHLYVRASSLAEIADLLRQLSEGTICYVIRGRALDSAGDYHRRKWVGTNATIEDIPRNWLMVDIDKPVCEVSDDWQDNPTELVHEIILKALPDEFQGAGAIWQWSSSMGVRAGVIKVHLWFRLDRPVNSQDAKRWLQEWDMYLDVSVFQAGQPHFTATPIFRGMTDPISERIGMIDGPDVAVPNIERLVVAPDFNGKNRVVGRGYEYYRDLIGKQDFHMAMRAAVGSYISRNSPNPDIDWLSDDLRRHVLTCDAPGRTQSEREHRAGEHLDKLIEWTLARHEEGEKQRAKDLKRAQEIIKAYSDPAAELSSGSILQKRFFAGLKK